MTAPNFTPLGPRDFATLRGMLCRLTDAELSARRAHAMTAEPKAMPAGYDLLPDVPLAAAHVEQVMRYIVNEVPAILRERKARASVCSVWHVEGTA